MDWSTPSLEKIALFALFIFWSLLLNKDKGKGVRESIHILSLSPLSCPVGLNNQSVEEPERVFFSSLYLLQLLSQHHLQCLRILLRRTHACLDRGQGDCNRRASAITSASHFIRFLARSLWYCTQSAGNHLP